MTDDFHTLMLQCLRRMLRPVARFCLNRSLSIQDLLESSKVVFIEMAAEELKKAGKKVNVSRLSAATGLRRKEVDRIYRYEDIKETDAGFGTRIIGQWRRDPRFLTRSNRPRVLSVKGDESEFNDLVRLISTDLHPRAVLANLETIGAIERVPGGVRLKAKAYKTSANTADGFKMLAADSEDLVNAVLDNFAVESEDLPNYHAKTFFNNISKSDIPKIRRWLFKQCSALQLKAESYLARYDLDLNPELKKRKKEGGARVTLGIFTKTPPDL